MQKLLIISALILVGVAVFSYYMQQAPIHDSLTQQYQSELQKIAQQINSNPHSTWKAGTNTRFENMGKEAIQGIFASKLLSRGHQETTPLVSYNQDSNQIPDSFDARSAWPNCQSIKEIRDQANCGSCWAFAAVGVMSDRICIASNQTLQTRISSQDLLTCCAACGDGCDGGDPTQAFAYYYNHGIVTGDLYNDTNWCKPYSLAPCDHHINGTYGPCPSVVPTPACTSSCQSSYKTPYGQDLHKASLYYGVTGDVRGIQYEIMTKGPIEAEFQVFQDFLTYKSGVYEHTTGDYLGLHDVRIIGWGSENGVDYWLIANSWNTEWGDNGFFKILRGKNHCGIESYLVTGLPIITQLTDN